MATASAPPAPPPALVPAPAATRYALFTLVVKLAVVFSSALALTAALCSYLLQQVRALETHSHGLEALSLRSFSSLAELQRSHEAFLYIFRVQYPLALLCFACIYVVKQTFAIPGSALLNVFAGAVLPLYVAFPLVAVLTACGASFCFLLSRFLASDAIVVGVCDRVLPHKLQQLRGQIDVARQDGGLLFMLLFLRVFPFTPNWFLNLASPWLSVPLYLFTPSVLFGLMPYNFITVQAGAMLSTLRSTSDMLNPRTLGSLVLIALGMLVPMLMKKRRQDAESSVKDKHD